MSDNIIELAEGEGCIAGGVKIVLFKADNGEARLLIVPATLTIEREKPSDRPRKRLQSIRGSR